jgi:hypothetical protein
MKNQQEVRFEVLTARRDAATVIMRSTVFWDALLCIILEKFIDVSEGCIASIFRVKK